MKTKIKVVIKGKWTECFNDKQNTYDIQIIKSDIRFGSGDDRDPWEIYQDLKLESYYIMFLEEIDGKVQSVRSEESFRSVNEAMEKAEETTKQKIKWTKMKH